MRERASANSKATVSWRVNTMVHRRHESRKALHPGSSSKPSLRPHQPSRVERWRARFHPSRAFDPTVRCARPRTHARCASSAEARALGSGLAS